MYVQKLFVVEAGGVGRVAGELVEEAGQAQMKIPPAAAAAVLVALAPEPVQLVVVALVAAAAAAVAAAADDGRSEVDVEARMSSYRGLR